MANFKMDRNNLTNHIGNLVARVSGNTIQNPIGNLVARVSGNTIQNPIGNLVARVDDVKKAIQGATGSMTDVALWWFFVRKP